MFLREDEEITTTEIYIPDFFDEEFDQRYDVRWKKRELLFTPAIGLHAGKEMLFAYDEEPQHVRFRDERICWNTGGYDPDCDRFIRSCLEIVMSVSSGVQLLPKNALLKSALVPRADHIARGLSWPMDAPGFREAAWKVETFLNGPLLVEIHSFGGLKIQFRLPEEASFMELYHSTEVAFFQYGCSLSDFRLCTMDGSAVLPRNARLKMNQTSLRNETDHDAAEALRHVKEGRAKAAELVEALERTWHVVVHDISGALVAKMEMPGSSTSSDCKQRLRHITWRFEPEGCMHLVLNDGEVWDSPRVLGSFKNSEDTCELQLTLVWASAFQFFAVPDRSRGVLLAGKGIFRPEDVPVKEEGVSRVAFGMLKNQSTSGAKNFALHTGGRGRDDGSGEPTIGLLTELLPGFHADDPSETTQGAIHVFELGPEVVRLNINVTSDGNQAGGSFYNAVLPLNVSSSTLRSLLSYGFLPGVQWTRLTRYMAKSIPVAFKDLKMFLQESPVQGFTLTH